MPEEYKEGRLIEYRNVIDENHGIDAVMHNGQWEYSPWYKRGKQAEYYKKSVYPYDRVTYDNYLQAHNHIARSLGKTTLKRGNPASAFWKEHKGETGNGRV